MSCGCAHTFAHHEGVCTLSWVEDRVHTFAPCIVCMKVRREFLFCAFSKKDLLYFSSFTQKIVQQFYYKNVAEYFTFNTLFVIYKKCTDIRYCKQILMLFVFDIFVWVFFEFPRVNFVKKLQLYTKNVHCTPSEWLSRTYRAATGGSKTPWHFSNAAPWSASSIIETPSRIYPAGKLTRRPALLHLHWGPGAFHHCL